MQDRSRIAFTIAAGVFLLALLSILSVVPIRRGYTPQYNSPDSVTSLEQFSLGGRRQYVLIRGKEKHNPILLFLHGGPGMSTMYLAHDFQRELERNFVVVQWDRRGAGKSYAAGVSPPNPSVIQEINDTIDLIDQLRSRFHQEKIYLVGFSYGTYLGILVAQRVPERLHA
jgi:pimeloyl-ACP methyl ester carboxylesterase